MADRPNILFLMSDEHRADVTGWEGNSVIRTPVLDALARDAVIFRNAYTPSPRCIPARQCMTAGQWAHTCGCTHYGQDLPPGYMTFPRRLSQHGYATVCAGKLHHVGTDQMQGWTGRMGLVDMRVDDSFIEGRDEAEYARIRQAIGKQKWSDAKEIQRAGPGKSRCAVNDRLTVDTALEFLERWFVDPMYDRPQSARPLLIKVSLTQPHYPFVCDADRFEYYLSRVTPFPDEHVTDNPILGQRRVVPGRDVSEREIRRALAAYYGMIEQLDEQFGRVVDKLERMGQDLDDWIVIYTTDHGDMMGEHGVWEKGQMYEGSARVPLLVRWPRRFAGRTVTQNVSLIDLFATLCELTGVPAPDGLDSRSLVPLMAGRSDGWDDEVLSEHRGNQFMIKRGNLKFLSFAGGPGDMLFDLAADPGETTDVIDQPAYAEAVAAFRARRTQVWG